MNASTKNSISTATAHPVGTRTPGGRNLGQRAVVLGGSLAGLLSASVLSRYFDQVVIVERDDLARHPGGPRRGVPQSRHTHGLLVAGSLAMERLLPGLTADLRSQGALQVDFNSRLRWWLGGAVQYRFTSALEGLLTSRSLLEDEVRRHVLRFPNIVLLGGYDVAGLVTSDDRRRVLGAQVARREPSKTPDDQADSLIEDGSVLGDLVVDASGRGSRATTWLTDLGYPAVKESVVEAGLTYATRCFRSRPGVLDDLDGDIIGSDPAGSRSGVALRQEDGIWSVTLAGSFGERPPTELDEFRAFARTLPTPGIAEVATECDPVGEPQTFHYPNSRWRHWEKLSVRPERFTVLGDAFCSFNPVYGQGMSSAALQAEALTGALDGGLDALPERAAKSFARVVATPWTLATGTDRRHVSQPAKPLPERLLDRYLDRLMLVAAHDQEVKLAFNRVLNLLAAPPSLLTPRVAVRVLRPGRRRARATVAA